MKSIFRNVALLVSLLALTTPSSGQGFLKKLKDAERRYQDNNF